MIELQNLDLGLLTYHTHMRGTHAHALFKVCVCVWMNDSFVQTYHNHVTGFKTTCLETRLIVFRTLIISYSFSFLEYKSKF